MRIRWSPEAAEDLERIVRYIKQDNPIAARQVAKILYDGITALKTFPSRGRVGRMEGSRELIFPSLPYIAVYRVTKQTVEVSRIYHAAQDCP